MATFPNGALSTKLVLLLLPIAVLLGATVTVESVRVVERVLNPNLAHLGRPYWVVEGPLVEEVFKLATTALVLLATWPRVRRFPVFVGSAVGLGFALGEMLLNPIPQGVDPSKYLVAWVVYAPFTHAFYAGLAAIVFEPHRSRIMRAAAPIAAIGMHVAFNAWAHPLPKTLVLFAAMVLTFFWWKSERATPHGAARGTQHLP